MVAKPCRQWLRIETSMNAGSEWDSGELGVCKGVRMVNVCCSAASNVTVIGALQFISSGTPRLALSARETKTEQLLDSNVNTNPDELVPVAGNPTTVKLGVGFPQRVR